MKMRLKIKNRSHRCDVNNMCLSMMIVKCIKQLNASDALIETSQLICRANQLTDFYMRATVAFNGLNNTKAIFEPQFIEYSKPALRRCSYKKVF